MKHAGQVVFQNKNDKQTFFFFIQSQLPLRLCVDMYKLDLMICWEHGIHENIHLIRFYLTLIS